VVIALERERGVCSDVEASIFGDDALVPLADWWMCERCADLFYSLIELGFCVMLGDDMRDLVKEYTLFYGPRKK
jgi:hypothetical protein